MALQSNIEYIANQPQLIDTPASSCTVEDFDYKNIINADDITKFQFKIFPYTYSAELALNAEINSGTIGTTTITSWTSGNMYYNPTNGGFAYSNSTNIASLVQNITNATAGALIEVTINFLTNNGCQVYVGSEYAVVPSGVVGELKFYGMVGSTGTPVVGVLYSGITVNNPLSVSYIRVKEVSLDYKFLLRDVNTGYTVYSLSLRSYVNATYFNGTDPFRRIDNYITYEHDWAGQAEGCYQIEVMDMKINNHLQNGLFNGEFLVDNIDENGSSLGWNGEIIETVSSTVDVTIASGQLTVVVPAVINDGWNMYTSATTLAGVTYTLHIDVASASASTSIAYGTVGDQTGVSVGGPGLINTTFIGDGQPFNLSVYSLGSASTVVFNYVRIAVYDENLLEGDYISNEFKLTNNSCDTIEISACNDVDSFGFSFPLSNFSLNTRLRGAITNPQYPVERNSYRNNIGNVRTTYFLRQKTKVIKLNLVPEYMLDFLTLLGGMDHIYIDEVEYVADKDEYIQLQYDAALDNFATVSLFLFEKGSTAINKVTTALGAGCGSDTQYLLDPEDITDPNDDTQITDPQTGDGIISLG